MELMTGKKEEKFREELGEHLNDIEACLVSLRAASQEFFENGEPAKCYEVIELESKADKQRRKVQAELFEGAFFPTLRGDFFNLIEVEDHIANQAEDVADILAFMKPRVPKEYSEEILRIIDETVAAFKLLKESILSLNDTKKAMELVGIVREKEKVVDDKRRELIKNVFADKGKLDDKMLLKELIESVATISNTIEDVSDIIFIMVIKMSG